MPEPKSPDSTAFTGRSRRKKTSWIVKFSDVFARALITVGGIGTIVAVCLVFVFLFFVVVPLFQGPSLRNQAEYRAAWLSEDSVRMTIDEYRTMGWALYENGRLDVFRLDTGEVIDRRALFDGLKITAVSFSIGEPDLALGFADGSIRIGTIGFEAEFIERAAIPQSLQDLKPETSAQLDMGIVRLTPQGQFRLQKVVVNLGQPIPIADAAITHLDHLYPTGSAQGLMGSKEYTACVYSADGELKLCRINEQKNMLGQVQQEKQITALELPEESSSPVTAVLLTGRGDNVMLIRRGGQLLRYDTRTPDQASIVEVVDLLPDSDAKLTVSDFVLGRETIICGDTDGNLRAWFRVRREVQGDASDAFRMAQIHRLTGSAAAVRCFAPSQRSRMIAVGYDDGRMRIYHVTTEHLMLEQTLAGPDQPIQQIAIAPKDDGILAATATGIWRCDFEPGHPEATLASLFTPVWYEGYNEPKNIWQSSFAGVAPEMKLGLWPLIFGTLKATFYSMLFGAPLALLAAIYTSEFLAPRTRGRIKPAIEMMASLPSVVLGFLAALVFAPLVEDMVPVVLVCFLTVPLTYLLASQLWQLIPYRLALRWARYRFLVMCLILPIGFLLGWYLGPVVERALFAGDIKRWLDGQIGSGTAAWLFVLVPLSGLVMLAVITLRVNPWLRNRANRWTRSQFALINLVKVLLGLAGVTLLAVGLGSGLNYLGWDPRGSYVDTYEQRNALVVGFVMGFAIIPIIYTIADDALSTVPNHLRSGSLGCGATPWQTTWRVVIPTAMSGLFSALMIGLGRAVGETMIVLMAGGNTPVTDWNIFNGFRTLAANIAVELPEAVRNSTHYRTLFLAALTLFVLTFIINTVAEMIRLRFRKRAYQL